MYRAGMPDRSATDGPDDTDLVLLLLRTAGDIERKLDRMLASTRGISFSEFHLIRELATTHHGAASRVELAESVGLTPSAVTRALKPMEKMGFVATEKSERDARRSIARLTPAGQELLADAQHVVEDGIDDLHLGLVERTELAGVLRGLAR